METLQDIFNVRGWLVEKGLLPAGTADYAVVKKAAALALASGELSPAEYRALLKKDSSMSTTSKSADPAKVFGGGNVRVKGVDGFNTKRVAGAHKKTGCPVLNDRGSVVELPSERDLAEFGAFLKQLGRKSLGVATVDPTDIDRALIESLHSKEWAGTFNGRYEIGSGERLGTKAILDDITSGGIEAAPIFFDDLLITTPLLSGEIFPFVQTVDISRGRRVEGASIGNVTLNSGGADNTEISLFNTATFIAAFDTSIHVVDFACEIGLDFLSDSPLDVGSVMQQLISEKLLAWLDEQVLLGDGTTEPEGIFVGSGTTAVTSDNGSPGPWTLADVYDCMFGVSKVYRNSSQNPCFFSNDTMYARSRQIKIDAATPSTDQRPVFGIDSANSYMTLDWPHRIQNDLSNRRLGFGALKRYRMYRRVGMEFKLERGGSYLARRNLGLVIARARFGGQMANADAFALITDGQT